MLVVRETMSLRDFPRLNARSVHGGLASSRAYMGRDIAEYYGPDKLLDLGDLRG